MLARLALRDALKGEFVVTLLEAGFRGTFPTWRVERDGDVVVVDVQSGQYNEVDHGDFFVNLAVVPPPWRAWTHECAVNGPWGSTSRRGKEHAWDGLYVGRLQDGIGGSDVEPGTWSVASVAEADAVAARMTTALRHTGLPTIWSLLGPGRMLDAFRSGAIDDSTPAGDRAGMRDIILAVLLTEVDGQELEATCRRLDEFAGREYSELPLATASWARERAALLHASQN